MCNGYILIIQCNNTVRIRWDIFFFRFWKLVIFTILTYRYHVLTDAYQTHVALLHLLLGLFLLFRHLTCFKFCRLKCRSWKPLDSNTSIFLNSTNTLISLTLTNVIWKTIYIYIFWLSVHSFLCTKLLYGQLVLLHSTPQWFIRGLGGED